MFAVICLAKIKQKESAEIDEVIVVEVDRRCSNKKEDRRSEII